MPTLLIIRPSNRPQQDIQTCHAAGWQAQVLSPIEIEADRSALNKLPEQFKQADVVFWVSPTAIETAAPHLNFSDGHTPSIGRTLKPKTSPPPTSHPASSRANFSIRFRRNFPDSSNPCYTSPTIRVLPMRFASSAPNM